MRRQKKNRSYLAIVALAGGAVVLSLTWNMMSSALLPALETVTQKAAVLSMLINMPEGGLALIEEKFNSELFSSEEMGEPIDAPSSSVSAPAPAPESSSSEQPVVVPVPPTSSSSTAPKLPAPEIEKKYRGNILEEDFSGKENNSQFYSIGSAYLRNYTKLTTKEIGAQLEKPLEMKIPTLNEPLVLIVHTHATESYEEYDSEFYDKRNNWRSTDNNKNMVAVGDALAKSLEANGIGVIHDTTQHDYPSYNGSYERSAKTIKTNLEKYPSIKVVLDVHRDAIERTGEVIVKPTTIIDGKKAAQMMIITGSEDGTMNVPNWPSNLRFGAALANYMEEDYKTLSRPIFFCYRKYNMDLSKGSLLLEFGSHANTLEEAKYTATLVGNSLSRLLKDLSVNSEG